MSGNLSVTPDIVRKWHNGVLAVDDGRLREAASLFWDLRDFSAKMWFNMSIVHILQGDLTAADEKLKECVQRDEYLAVAYFHRGIIACRQGRLAEGQGIFAQTLKSMRTCDSIDYKQLGLDLRLTRQQVLQNQKTIDSCLTANKSTAKIVAEELQTLPILLFRPAKALVNNIEKREFLKPSQVISAMPDCVMKKPADEVKRPQSFSTPTSPSAHHRLVRGENSHSAQRHSTYTPPPSRPPPRLLTSNIGGINNRHRDNQTRMETTRFDQRDQQPDLISQHPSVLTDRADPSPSSVPTSTTGGSSAGPSAYRSTSRTTSTAPTRTERCQCKELRAVCDGCGGVGNSRSLSSDTNCTTSKKLAEKLEMVKTSCPQRSVTERVQKMEMRMSNQGQSFGEARPIVRSFGGHGVEVKCEGSGAEGGMKSGSNRPKVPPARPPPPKFGS